MPQDSDKKVQGIEERIGAYGRALTAPEVATLFKLTKDAIYKAARSGSIPSFRIDSSVRFDPKKLIEWYRKHSIG